MKAALKLSAPTILLFLATALGVYPVSKIKVKIKQISAPVSVLNRALAWIRWDRSYLRLYFIFSASDRSSSPALQQTLWFHFRQPLPPATAGCLRPEAYLTALHRAPQAAGLSDCCNMLHISLGTHTECNLHWAPHQSLTMPHPRSPLLRWNERCAICHIARLHTRPGK